MIRFSIAFSGTDAGLVHKIFRFKALSFIGYLVRALEVPIQCPYEHSYLIHLVIVVGPINHPIFEYMLSTFFRSFDSSNAVSSRPLGES
jgi:hypothetical protein